MPLHPPEQFFDAIDPEDQAREAFDHWHAPHPYAGPNAPRSTQTDAYVEAGTGDDRPDDGGGGGGTRRPGIITPFARGVGGGFNSTAADMGSVVIERSLQGAGWLAGAGISALAKGTLNGAKRIVGIHNDTPDTEPEESAPEPLEPVWKPRPKAKAEPTSPWYHGSGASSSSSPPQRAMPWGVNALAPAVPVEVPTFDLTAEDADTEHEVPPGPAAAAARRRTGFRQIAERDVRAAQDTLAALGPLPRKRNGRA
jgi:hypothetical protein